MKRSHPEHDEQAATYVATGGRPAVGLELNEAKRLKQLEDENRRLKRLVADQALDIQILKEVNSGKY